jgi:hypothetical protein
LSPEDELLPSLRPRSPQMSVRHCTSTTIPQERTLEFGETCPPPPPRCTRVPGWADSTERLKFGSRYFEGQIMHLYVATPRPRFPGKQTSSCPRVFAEDPALRLLSGSTPSTRHGVRNTFKKSLFGGTKNRPVFFEVLRAADHARAVLSTQTRRGIPWEQPWATAPLPVGGPGRLHRWSERRTDPGGEGSDYLYHK